MTKHHHSLTSKSSEAGLKEQQLTQGKYNLILTNTAIWSHDGNWIYYDVRSDAAGTQFDGQRIERVHAESGEVQVVYRSEKGACCGVVTASSVEDKIVFIHGPENPTPDWTYSFWHRRGVTVQPGVGKPAFNLDARDLISPYTPGALRGGTHVHVFSGDGKWISFTYDDHVLANGNLAGAQQNQRNVGVAAPYGPVSVPKTHPRNHNGSAFSVLVTKTWDTPIPGSDEINRAHSDAWVGTHGYVRTDGIRQARALAFIGDTVTLDGNTVSELFVVDIPEDVRLAGNAPLCGTETTRPAPPSGVSQRRLTHTSMRKYPGLGPMRHWPRSNPDGSLIAFIMRDDVGIAQLWTISPNGGEMHQLTEHESPIESAFTWRPDGRAICCVAGGRVSEVDASSGEISHLTDLSAVKPRPEAVVYSPDGSKIAFVRSVTSAEGTFNQIFVVTSRLPHK